MIEPASAEWEKLCANCGRCCYEKYEYRGKVFYTDVPCKHLDTKTNRCRIYTNRATLHPECAQLTPKLVAAGILPDDCPYVEENSVK